MTNAERLARFPNELRLLLSPWPRLLLISVAAILLFACLNSDKKVVWLFGSGFCVLTILGTAVFLLPGMYNVVLRHDAMVVTGFFRRRAHPWSQVSDFVAFEQGIHACVPYRNLGLPNNGMCGGRNAGVQPVDGMTPQQTAALLSQWRELALSDRNNAPPETREQTAKSMRPLQPTARPEPAMEITPLSLKSARLLAGFPEPQVIGHLGPINKALLVGLTFTLGVIIALARPGATGLLIFAVVLPLTILLMRKLGLQNALKLDRDGIEIFRGRKRWRHSWQSVQDFAPVRFNSLRGLGLSAEEFVACTLADQPPLWMLERADRPRSPTTPVAYVLRSTVLPGGYEFSSQELANLLNKWRARALAGAHDKNTTAEAMPNGKVA